MVTQQHANGAVGLSDLADHFVPDFPDLFAAAILSETEHSCQTRGLEQGDLRARRFVGNVSRRSIFGQDPGYKGGTFNPFPGGEGQGGAVEGLVVNVVDVRVRGWIFGIL